MKSIKRFILIFFVLSIAFCACKKEGRTDVLPKDKMVSVMSDMQRAVATAQIANDTNISLKEERISKYQRDVAKKHNITLTIYNNSINYYSQRPKEMKTILEAVAKNLNN